MSDHLIPFWWMSEIGREGKKKGRRKEGRKKQRGRGEAGVDSFHTQWEIARQVARLGRRRAGRAEILQKGVLSVRRAALRTRSWALPLRLPALRLSVSHYRWGVLSLPRLNRRQLNTQMYSSSLGCWRGNIFWKIWQLSITAPRNWWKEERATKEALNRIFKGHSPILYVTFQSDILRLKQTNKPNC